MSTFVPPTLGGSGTSRYSQVIDGGHYWVQEEWSNADFGCKASARPDAASFQAPKRVRTDQRMTFTARASVGHGRVKAYTWFFGSRGQARGRVVKHAFTRAGSYRLVLRVTDSWDNWAYAVHTVTVTGATHATRKPARRR